MSQDHETTGGPARPDPTVVGPTADQTGLSLSFTTADQDAAHERASKAFAPHELQLTGEDRLDFRMNVVPSPRLTMGTMRYGATATIRARPLLTCYHLVFPAAGQNNVSQNGVCRDIAAGRAGIVLDPRHPLKVVWSADSWQYHIKVPTAVLDSHAARLAGAVAEGVRFEVGIDLMTGAGRALFSMVKFLTAEFSEDGGLGANPLACRELESAFMTQLLLAASNQFSHSLFAESRHMRRSTIDGVLSYIEANLQEEISTVDLVGVAGVGPRALQAAFRKATGVSPTAYVRGARLDRVRLELSAGTGQSVTDAATRWGFHHLGRFSQQYHQRFGELPSETGRRLQR